MSGAGAQTADGIEIVHVGGQSDGNFRLQNRAVAGAWEYFLHKGNAGGTDGNWYLRSELPPEPQPQPQPQPTPDKPVQKVYRPEAGSYIANIAAANTLFNIRMHDREGGKLTIPMCLLVRRKQQVCGCVISAVIIAGRTAVHS